MLALLVAVSLILLTAYFGEQPNSPLHNVQRGVVEVLSPVEQGASKVLAPVRSAAGWFSSTFHAKTQVKQLQQQVARLTNEYAQAKSAQLENRQLSAELHLDTSLNLSTYHPVSADVILRDPTLWYQTINVDKGSDDGVSLHDPVVGDGALVGEVTEVSPTVSVVTLITDHTLSVTARVLDANGDTGELVPAVGNPDELVLQYLQPPNPGQVQNGPQQGQLVVTAGFKSGPLESYFPANIPIGNVLPVDENQLLNNGTIQVSPQANLRSVDVVQILTKPQPGTERAQVP
ncbi:MAG TPA: rod shape-determining protein MreC [Solirubrobacteraceae bacterium]|nr:rod shape-determining protein MreC [Solirubrobacteraceae bacterium]